MEQIVAFFKKFFTKDAEAEYAKLLKVLNKVLIVLERLEDEAANAESSNDCVAKAHRVKASNYNFIRRQVADIFKRL